MKSIWLLKFNPEKCKVMHVSYNCNPKNIYELDGVVLENIQSEKDLGVTVNHDSYVSKFQGNKNFKETRILIYISLHYIHNM